MAPAGRPPRAHRSRAPHPSPTDGIASSAGCGHDGGARGRPRHTGAAAAGGAAAAAMNGGTWPAAGVAAAIAGAASRAPPPRFFSFPGARLGTYGAAPLPGALGPIPRRCPRPSPSRRRGVVGAPWRGGRGAVGDILGAIGCAGCLSVGWVTPRGGPVSAAPRAHARARAAARRGLVVRRARTDGAAGPQRDRSRAAESGGGAYKAKGGGASAGISTQRLTQA